ncbi:Gfo/Idh/MocA family protein [Paenibacillus mesophilus]|uniref:Gfo/Idh/MocA family protein n=1 Tax=Paenibacillus mesophilus TaxID=2582849 RepID=UPI0013052700|nr:Gfo/Idh/MocA family oxidoreductase [Paenibacillus mesophilus]
MSGKVRVGIIGLGSWGECHLEAFHALPHAEVVAVCDTRADRLKHAEAEYGVRHCYTDYEQLLEREDIDLVSVVTFEKMHLEPTVKALRSGKHVLVEKPVSTRKSEALEMRKVAGEYGRYVLPGHLLRFDPRYADMKRAINAGEIGQPVSMYMKRSRENKLFATYRRTHTVYELTIHDIDLAIWYAGSRVKSVRAHGRSVTNSDVPEVLWACLEFENGTLAHLHSNWMTPDKAGIAIADQIEVIGSKGTAHFETSNSGLQIWNGSGRTTPDTNIHIKTMHKQTAGSLREQLIYICDCLNRGIAPDYISFEDAIHGVEVADAIVQSADAGKEIVIG